MNMKEIVKDAVKYPFSDWKKNPYTGNLCIVK